MSLLTALGYYLGGQGQARQQSRDNARQDRQDAAASEYQQAILANDRQRLGMEQTAATEKKRLDDATLQQEGIDPSTGQYYPFNPNTQVRPNNKGKRLASDTEPGTLAMNSRRLAGEAERAQRPDQAKFYQDQATGYDTGAWRESTVGLNRARSVTDQAKAALERAQAAYFSGRNGVALQVAQAHEIAARYGADQRYRGVIAQVDGLIARANLSAETARYARTLAVWSATRGQDINASVRTAIANAQAAEALAATEAQNAQTGSEVPTLAPLPVPPMPTQDFAAELKAMHDAGYDLKPIAPLPVPGTPVGDTNTSGNPPIPGGGPNSRISPMPQPWLDEMSAMEKAYGLPRNLIAAIASQESSGGKNMGPSSAGALGLTQFMPGTAKTYGVDRNNPLSEIDGTAHYMADLIRQNGGDLAAALEQYNGYGPGYAREVMARMNPGVPPTPGPSTSASPQPTASPSALPTPGPSASPSAAPSPGPSAVAAEEAAVKAGVNAFLASPAAAGKSFAEQWSLLQSMLAKKSDTTPQDYALAEKFLLEQRAEQSPQRSNPFQAIESGAQNALDAARSFAGSVMHPQRHATAQPTKALKPLPIPPRKSPPTPTPLPIRTLSPLPFHTPRFSPVQDYQDRLLRGGKVFINDASKFGNQLENQVVAPGEAALQAYGKRLQRGAQGLMQGASQIGNDVKSGMGKALVPPTPEAQPTAIPTATPTARPTLAPLPIATPGSPQFQNPDDELSNLLRRLQEILRGQVL